MPAPTAEALHEAQVRYRQELLGDMTIRNGRWFDTEMDKLDRWAEDRRASLQTELAELDEALKEAKKAARLAPTLPEKLERQRAARTLESRREEAWRIYDQASRDIDHQKDALLDEISRRLEQKTEEAKLCSPYDGESHMSNTPRALSAAARGATARPMTRVYVEMMDLIEAGTTPSAVVTFQPAVEAKTLLADLIHGENMTGSSAEETLS